MVKTQNYAFIEISGKISRLLNLGNDFEISKILFLYFFMNYLSIKITREKHHYNFSLSERLGGLENYSSSLKNCETFISR